MFAKLKVFSTSVFNRALLKMYSGSGFGYFTGNFVGGKEVGQPGRLPSMVFNVGEWQVHLHHWLTSFAILSFVIIYLLRKHKLTSFVYSPIFGFLIGLMIHGIFDYNDWYKILIKKNA